MSNTRRTRLFVGLAFWLVALAHQKIFADVANTPEGMLMYHGGAALFDLVTLVISAHLLVGRLSDEMQSLCLIAMCVNAVGWILYLAWIPALVYNSALIGVSHVQYLRLLLGDHNGVDSIRSHMVRGAAPWGAKLHNEKAQQ